MSLALLPRPWAIYEAQLLDLIPSDFLLRVMCHLWLKYYYYFSAFVSFIGILWLPVVCSVFNVNPTFISTAHVAMQS